jgi:hypothetical protein
MCSPMECTEHVVEIGAHLLAVGPVHEDDLKLGDDEEGHWEQDGQDQREEAQQNWLQPK